MDGFQKYIFIFVLSIVVLSISKIFVNCILDFSYEKFSIFLFSLFVPVFYLAMKEKEFIWLSDLNKSLLENKEIRSFDVFLFKIPFLSSFLFFVWFL